MSTLRLENDLRLMEIRMNELIDRIITHRSEGNLWLISYNTQLLQETVDVINMLKGEISRQENIRRLDTAS